VAASFPAECRHVLETLGEVYNNDALAREQGMSSAERLSFHKAQSGPIMDGFQKWLTQQLMDRLVEPNSGLGRAMTYFLRHWDALTLFQEGHPAQEERFILQDPKRRLGRRCLHEPDPHVRVVRRQSVRLSGGTAATRRRDRGESSRMDALELSGHTRARQSIRRCPPADPVAPPSFHLWYLGSVCREPAARAAPGIEVCQPLWSWATDRVFSPPGPLRMPAERTQ